MSDSFLHDQLRAVGETYLRLVDDKPAFARRQSEYWAQVARLEQRHAERLDWRPKPKTPSGTFAGVTEALSRAKTEAHNPGALLEQARELDAEHRPTPVVPDPREDP